MHFFSTVFAKSALGLAAVGSLALGGADIKHEIKHDDLKRPAEVRSSIEVAIGAQGRVHIKGATVTAVSGNTISATTKWGGTTINWSVMTDANTKFLYKGGRAAQNSTVAVGDVINVDGAFASSGQFAVNASVVRDTSKEKSAEERHTFEGKLVALASTTAPTTLTIQKDSSTYTVNVAANTAILGKNWGGLSLGAFQINDSVRVYGSLATASSTTIDALVVRNATR